MVQRSAPTLTTTIAGSVHANALYLLAIARHIAALGRVFLEPPDGGLTAIPVRSATRQEP